MQAERYGSATAAARRLTKTNVPGIYRRGTRYVVRFRDARGHARKRSARTMAEARQLKAELTADVGRGEFRALSRVTFADYAREWIATYQGRTSRGFRETTREEYRRELERDAIPFFGRMRFAEIEPRDIKRFATRLAEVRGLAPGSVRLVLAPVRAMFATAVEEGLIRSNPAAGLRIAQRVQSEDVEKRKALTEDELRAFLAEIPTPHRLLFELLAHTGLRISEALGLQWGDVDFGARRLRVRRALRNGVLAPPKSRYGRRDVPLSARMAQQPGRGARRLATAPTPIPCSPPLRGCRSTSPTSTRACSSRPGSGRPSVGGISHAPAHLRDHAVPPRAECEAGAGLARPPQSSVHARRLRPLAAE